MLHYTLKEAARLTGYSPATLKVYAANGRAPKPTKVGNLLFLSEKQIAAFRRKNPRQPTGTARGIDLAAHVTYPQVAKLTGLSRSGIVAMLWREEFPFPARYVGEHTFFKRADVEKWKQKNQR